MPSFLIEENAPIYTQSPGILHLDPSGRFGALADTASNNEKVNGQAAVRPREREIDADDRFDESSTHSTDTSDMSGLAAEMTGTSSSDTTTMSAADGAIGETADRTDGVDAGYSYAKPGITLVRRPLPNGKTVSRTSIDQIAPDEHAVPARDRSQFTDGASESKPAAPRTKAGTAGSPDGDAAQQRDSVASSGAGSLQASPVEVSIRHVSRADVITLDNGTPSLTTIPSETAVNGFAPSPPPLSTSSTPNPEASSRGSHPTASPHRFSSPPLYHPAAAVSGASSTSLHPGPAPGLRHRHTLEVPKVAPPRGSREGVDAGFTSGRFSPTGAAGVPPAAARRASLSLGRRNTRSLHSEVPRDEIVPDEDALRWAEAYRQKRASKRKRIEQDDDRVLVGTKVDETHANWVTAYNMLTGIRVSVSRTNAKLDRPLTDADFHAKQKSTFDIAGNELVPSAKYDFKFKDYAPWVFRHLRALFRLDPADYLMSLTGKYILSELGSPGKSGSFFYFSRDYKYIIKTIHHSEHKFLRKILKDYYEHITENPNTLLSQFYGLHRVKMPYGKKIHFVVMNNLFPPHRDIHQTFDLKGSTVGRDYREEDLAKNPRATLKDLNWLRRHQHLEFGIIKKKLFLEQLQKDVRLLQRLEIMDYSLLIGIHDLQRGNEENLRGKTLQVFNPGGDNTPDDFDPHAVLMRTPSKLEHQRKARELRQMIKSERPIPIGQSGSRMPDELDEGYSKESVFYHDDGGIRATHENNAPGDEIYYLGIIDCLTHYGIIKKIEHFWKGLSHDRNQISALPPQQYGERFLNFMSGITMSPEEASRDAQERDQAAQAAAAAEAAAAAAGEQDKGKEKEHGVTWSVSHRRKSTATQIPPMPNYPPPPQPTAAAQKTSEIEAVLRRAEREAQKSPRSEEEVPERILKTTSPTAGVIVPATAVAAASPAAATSMKHGPQTIPHVDRRESSAAQTIQTILPIVEEAGEGSSTGERSRNSHLSHLSYLSSRTAESDGRPLTPAKDGEEREAGFANPILSYHGSGRGKAGGSNGGRNSPPTPPMSGYLKPESADSGYGVGVSGPPGLGRSRSGTAGSAGKVKIQLSRESLDKELPPLPKLDGRS